MPIFQEGTDECRITLRGQEKMRKLNRKDEERDTLVTIDTPKCATCADVKAIVVVFMAPLKL